MARMNNLLDKYGVRSAARATRDLPVEPPKPEIPPMGRDEPQDLHRGTFRIKSGNAKTPPDPNMVTLRKIVESRSGESVCADIEERCSLRRENGKAGPIPGTFGQSRGTRSAVVDGSGGSSTGQRVSQSMRGLIERLPSLWGIDLVLILISLVGIIAILTHLPAVLLALAKIICSAISLLFGAALLLVIGVVVLLWLRSPHRSRW